MMMSKYWLIDPWRRTSGCPRQLWRSRALYLLPQEAAVMNCRQVSVMDLDQLVQVLCFLYLVLKLQSCAVQDLERDDVDTWEIVSTFLYLYVIMVKFVTFPKPGQMWRCKIHSIWTWSANMKLSISFIMSQMVQAQSCSERNNRRKNGI